MCVREIERVRVWEREGESERVCVREREIERVSVWEREGESERVCVRERERLRE